MRLSKDEQQELYRLAPFYKYEGKEDFPINLYGDKELEDFVSRGAVDSDLKILKDKLRLINELAGKYWIEHRRQQRLIEFMDYKSTSYPTSETDKHIYAKKRFLVGKEVPLIPIFSKLQYWENCFNKTVNPPAMELIQKQCLKWIEKIEMRMIELNLHNF